MEYKTMNRLIWILGFTVTGVVVGIYILSMVLRG